MNLTTLFETQRKLDEHIIREKGLAGQDLLPNTILALQVEIGELANEWRGFKFWSNNQEPRTCIGGEYLNMDIDGKVLNKNPLLEEYVDCLHFILSIGLILRIPEEWSHYWDHEEYIADVTDVFLNLFKTINRDMSPHEWFETFDMFNSLGEMLGFTQEQIEEAYYAKNKINHQRQESGY